MKSIFGNLELIFKRFATKLGDSRADETDSLVGFIMCINSLLLLSRVCSISGILRHVFVANLHKIQKQS